MVVPAVLPCRLLGLTLDALRSSALVPPSLVVLPRAGVDLVFFSVLALPWSSSLSRRWPGPLPCAGWPGIRGPSTPAPGPLWT